MEENKQEKLLDVEKRIHSFDEVVLGYTQQEAVNEASRCLNCINHPCLNSCPLHNNIPLFISQIKNKEFEKALETLSLTSPFPQVCSRVCAKEKQCESKCTRGIKQEPIHINLLERFISDNYSITNKIKQNKNNIKVAIVGAGPSGLACAKLLATNGFDVTIYEEYKQAGGILTYGIPEFRLPKQIVNNYINQIIQLGVKINYEKQLGRDVSISSLQKEYKYIYISIGTSKPVYMNIDGEDLNGVYVASKFLKDIYEKKINNLKNKKVVIIGGGNVAMDVARSVVRLNGEANILYRRTIEQMPACEDELQQALQENVHLSQLVKPLKIKQEKDKLIIECIKTKLGEPDASGRSRPVDIENSEFEIECDNIVVAVSSQSQSEILSEIKTEKGLIVVNENQETSIKNIYAGGDIVHGPYTVVHAIKDGLTAAKSIIQSVML